MSMTESSTATTVTSERPRLAVLGAGPTGLEAALAADARDWDVVVYEQAAHVAAHVRRWGHVRLFTPWSMNLSARQQALRDEPGEACPTGHEYAAHLDRVAALLPDVRLCTRVEQIGRAGLLKSEEIASERRRDTPFRLLVTGPDGRERAEYADVVLDCTGTYCNPNPTGDGGIPAPGERELADRIVRSIPAIMPEWADQKVLLVGAGYSAQTVARGLASVGASLIWAVRASAPTWGAVPADPLPERAALVTSSQRIAAGAVPGVELVTGVVVEAMRPVGDRVAVTVREPAGRTRVVEVDRVVSMTGSVGDARLYRQLQVHECYATEGPITLAASLLGAAGGDCLDQTSAGVEALRNPEPRFFVLGSKSYGRNNTFLLRVGWQQVEEVLDALDADRDADLPAGSSAGGAG